MKLKKKLILALPYAGIALTATKLPQAWRLAPGMNASQKLLVIGRGFESAFSSPLPSFDPRDLLVGFLLAASLRLAVYVKGKKREEVSAQHRVWLCALRCIILTVNNDLWTQEGYAHERI